MIRFKTSLQENSFWKDQAEKSKFVADDKLIMNGFIFAFIGAIAFLHGAKDNSRAKVYFRGDQKLRVDTITDDNKDVSLIIKIMADQGFFKTIQTAHEITRFLVKVKSGQIDTVDENIIRGWIGQIKPDKLKNLSAVVKRELKDFMDGGSLATFGDQLKANAKVTRWKNSEFHDLAKTLRMDPAKKVATPVTPVATTAAASTTDGNDGVTASSTTATPAAAVKASVKAVSLKNPPVPKFVVKPAVPADIWADLSNNKSSQEILNSYTKITQEMKTGILDLAYRLYRQTSNPEGVMKNMIEVLKSGAKVKTTTWKKSWFPVFHILQGDHFIAALKHTPWDDFGSPTNADNNKIYTTVSNIIKYHHLTVNDPVERFIEVRNIYKTFFDSDLISSSPTSRNVYNWVGYLRNNERPIGHFLRILNRNKETYKKDFLSTYLRHDAFLSDSGSNTFNYDYDGAAANPSLRVIPTSILKFLEVQQASKIGLLIAERGKNDFWERIMLDLDQKDIPEFVTKFREVEGSGNSITDSYIIWSQKFAQTPKSIELYNKIISDEVISKKLFSNMKGSWSTKDFSSLLPATVALIMSKFLKYLENEDKNVGISTSEVDGSYRQFEKNGLGGDKDVTTFFKNVYMKLLPTTLSGSSWRSRGDVLGEPMTPNNPLWGWTTDKEKDIIDNMILDKVEKGANGDPWSNQITTENRPIRAYKDMSKPLQGRVRTMMSNSKLHRALNPIIDTTFYDNLSYEQLNKEFPNNLVLLSSVKPQIREELFNRYSSDPKFRENVYENLRPEDTWVISFAEDSKDYDLPEFRKIMEKLVNNKNIGDTYWLGGVAASQNKKTAFNRKSALYFETYTQIADEKMNKLTSEYKSFMTSAQSQFMTYVDYDRKAAENFYGKLTKSMRRRLAAQYMQRGDFLTSAKAALTDKNTPIKPFEQLTDQRIKEILKYNNVTSDESKLPDSVIRDFSTMDSYLKKTHASTASMKTLAVEEINHTTAELNQMSADYHRQKRSNKHGEISMVFKRAFKVDLKMQNEQQAEWIAKNPKQEIIKPMYHGTGSVAASMILRYGWRIIKSGDKSVVGRMLGDGVYGAIHIDKSQQYVGDNGYGRSAGTKGYIFVMVAALGEKNVDYRAMGLGNDHIRSPEWCVFTPNSQFRIIKAYEVELVRPEIIRDITNKYPKNGLLESENVKRFRSYLTEETDDNAEIESVQTFTFVNGLIPTDLKRYVELEDFKSPGERITLEPSAYGPTVVIRGTETSANYLFTGPDDLIENEPDVYDRYIRYFAIERNKG